MKMVLKCELRKVIHKVIRKGKKQPVPKNPLDLQAITH